jgi:phosphoribosyl 1,2-cyclic phosphodiesterase
MLARIWGCRGSLATPGPGTLRYGGNTSCVEIRPADGSLIILDAGTGIRNLGWALPEERPHRIHLLLTHMHLDHVEGLGFFLPLFDAETELHVWGPSWPYRSLRDRVASYLAPPLFPLLFDQIPAQLAFHEVPEGTPWEIGAVRVQAEPVTHPAPTVGYRLEENGCSLAFIPDNEPALSSDLSGGAASRVSGLVVAHDVDLLLHDCQYTAEEYATRRGWGHTCVPDFVRFIELAGARRVLMFHHEPAHADETLDAMLDEARALAGVNGERVQLAAEGMELDLTALG